LKKIQIAATRDNDADAMTGILDENFMYINGSGKIYDRDSYITAICSHEITYSSDLQLNVTSTSFAIPSSERATHPDAGAPFAEVLAPGLPESLFRPPQQASSS
jgi:hypothetical protein